MITAIRIQWCICNHAGTETCAAEIKKRALRRRKINMDTNQTELNINEMEMVNGGGVITGFNPYLLPSRKRQKDKTGNEQ